MLYPSRTDLPAHVAPDRVVHHDVFQPDAPDGDFAASMVRLRDSGVPDLFIPEWQLWIEMKRTKGGSVSMEQKDWMLYLQKVGYCVKVCKGAEDAKGQIQAFVTIENLE